MRVPDFVIWDVIMRFNLIWVHINMLFHIALCPDFFVSLNGFILSCVIMWLCSNVARCFLSCACVCSTIGLYYCGYVLMWVRTTIKYISVLIQVEEIYDLQREPLVENKTCYGAIFLFRWIEERRSRRKLLDEEELYVRSEEEVNSIFFAYQVSGILSKRVRGICHDWTMEKN